MGLKVEMSVTVSGWCVVYEPNATAVCENVKQLFGPVYHGVCKRNTGTV